MQKFLRRFLLILDNPHLSIFHTFKTKKDQLTGEALRQRSIISLLATEKNSAKKTRTAMSQSIGKKNGIVWKNIYSGIFRDLDEILIPLGIVREAGRLPLLRGPKALQEKGIPFYELTNEGLLVALSIDESSGNSQILDEFLSKAEIKEKSFRNTINILAKISPKFVYLIFEIYVKAYCNGQLDNLLPFDIQNLKNLSAKYLELEGELLNGFMSLSKRDKNSILTFFS